MSMSYLYRTAAMATALSLMGQGAAAQDVVAAGVGFTISIDDGSAAAQIAPDLSGQASSGFAPQQVDYALAASDIAVTFDGLHVKPRLDVVLLDGGRAAVGQTLRVQSQMNYPAFVTRGEIRIVDLAAGNGQRALQVLPIAPNGVAQITVPDAVNPAVIHRVYDARGRYDETAPLPLYSATNPEIVGDRAPEEGTTRLARQRIPVHGGAITVRGDNVPASAQVATLGETLSPDPSGSFVIQRILPPGDHPVQVYVDGVSQSLFLERDITVPANEWFYTGTVDLTYGWRAGDARSASGVKLPPEYSHGRIAGYAKGKVRGGWTLTMGVDTGEQELENLFDDFDKKDPYSTLLRMTRDSAYPTYGDDSTIEDGTPTDGKFYLKAERDGSHLLWGNFKSTVSGSTYLRNERQLYGAQALYRSPAQTSAGESRLSFEAYAATPNSLPGREVFRGTGGSIYFLQNADISHGSETVTVELRDRVTGRVVSTRTLAEGQDYHINYTQGSVVLRTPLSGSSDGGEIITDAGGEYDTRLIVQYEYTPAAGDVDGTNYGGRAEAWLTDNIRVGATGMVDRTGFADQTARGVDLRFQLSEDTYFDLEKAETDGPGFGSSYSTNGGLIVSNAPTAVGTGEAFLARGRADLSELGLGVDGDIAGYYEKRTAGFSTLDYQITDDEELWGVSARIAPSEAVTLRFYYDEFTNSADKQLQEGGAELEVALNTTTKLAFAAEHLTVKNPAAADDDTGSRTDIAARVTVEPHENLTWYVFGQATVDRSGGLKANDRIGAGLRYRFAENWTVEGEVSDGSQGTGGALLFERQDQNGDTAYVGYRLEPGRDFAGVTLRGTDRGTFVAGGRRKVNDTTTYYGENTYDLFGRHHALTSTYGVEYAATSFTTFYGGLEYGQVETTDNDDDYDRRGVSLGLRHDNGAGLQAKTRLEYRIDQGQLSGTNRDLEALLVSGDVRYEIDDERRLLFNLDYAETKANSASLQSGTYVDASLGYAVRPVLDDRFNMLFKYRYLFDSVGQEIDGSDLRGPRQESHVFSIDAEYDLNQKWSLGAKLGARLSESSPDDSIPLARNDAALLVLNARYHFVHKWDMLFEARHLEAEQAGLSETSAVGTVYRHVGPNLKLGVGYNFGSFSDDLTDLTYDDKGAMVNLIGKF